MNISALRIRLMDYVSDKSGNDPNVCVRTEDFIASNNITVLTALQLVQDCVQQGLLKDASGMGEPAAFITTKGIEAVQETRARREDPKLRSAALNKGLLHYFYAAERAGKNYPVTSGFLETDWSLYEGERFTEREVDKAAAYLENKGLIKGIRSGQTEGPIRAKITSDGIDCVNQFDGDVQAYVSAPASTGIPMITIGTINNHGGNTAIGSTGVTQQISGIDATGFAELARVLLDGLGQLPLDEGDLKEDVRAVLEEIQSEAKAQAEPGKLKTLVSKLGGYLAKAGQPVVTAALMVIAGSMGLPTG